MPTPDSWHEVNAKQKRRASWHTCDCEACPCDQVVKNSDICPGCRDGYHATHQTRPDD